MSPRRLGLLSLLLCLQACGTLTVPTDGGVTDAGGGDGGTTTGGGGGGGGGTATGGGGGTTTGGGGGTFEVLGFDQPGTSHLVALSGDEAEQWALDGAGWLFHATGGGFSRVTQLPGLATGLFAASGQVFALNVDTLSTCRGDCSDAGATWARWSLPTWQQGAGLCGRSASDVYATSVGSTAGLLFHFDGGSWAQVSALPIESPSGCTVDSDGTVYVAGRDGVARWANGGASFERVSSDGWPLLAVSALDGGVQAVGERFRIARRDASGSWSIVDEPLTSTRLLSVAGATPEALFAGGEGTSSTRHNWSSWDGTQWTNAPDNLASVRTIFSVFAPGPHHVYFAGSDPAGSGPAVVRLTR
jgi:hypothetical protein